MNELGLALSPAICKRLDVHCDDCVRARAESVSRISPGLTNLEAFGLFQTLYPSVGCAPMRELFVESYQEEIELGFGIISPDTILTIA